MCPDCIATVTLVVTSATSAGGLVALAMDKLRAKDGARSAGEGGVGTDDRGLRADEISAQAARDPRHESAST
jgi:hypothetical protein